MKSRHAAQSAVRLISADPNKTTAHTVTGLHFYGDFIVAITSELPTGPYLRGQFTGKASEYFGIWIVNILLTIITLGIYSAWAKVRRNRYFYGNTSLMGHSFDYHANGKQIFIGRLIVFVILIGANILSALHPVMAGIVPLVFLGILPWLVVRSLRFNMRVTSFRNVRFDFVGGAGGAFVAIVLGSLVSVFSLGLLAPFASRWLYRYLINNMRYGDRPLATSVRVRSIYAAWLLPALMIVGGLIVLGGGLALYSSEIQNFMNAIDGVDEPDDVKSAAKLVIMIYGIFIPLFIIYSLAGIFYRIGVMNAVMNTAHLDGRHPLMGDLGRMRYFWILLSNTIISILTVGLMRPWAAVRERRYLVEHLGIAFKGDIGEVMSSIQSTGTPVSAEYLDMEGFDFGF